jgi:hypothetical protein
MLSGLALARATTSAADRGRKTNVGLLQSGDARRRHARRPLPREDFGKSRFKGGYAKFS